MASLFSAPGQIVDAVRNINVPAAATTFSYKSVILYLVVFAIIGFIVFMLLGKRFDFSWLDFRTAHSKIVSKGHVFWETMPVSGKLVVPDDTVENFHNNRYTCLADVVLKNTRSPRGGNVYRHLLHRGSEDLLSGTLPAFGLPKRMNPGIFVDPNVNDILVYIDTVKNGTTFRESLRISDIPLDIPFRIAVLVSKRLLEVYINCKLETTKLLDGDPKEVENTWYGLSGSNRADAQIQNLKIWRHALTIDELSPLCPRQLPTFNTLSIPPACKSDKPPTTIDNMKEKLATVQANVLGKFDAAKADLKNLL